MKSVFVVGAGTMGLDIAQVLAVNGLRVTVRDISDAIVAKAAARLDKNLAKLVEKGKLEEGKRKDALGRVSFTTELAKAAGHDLVLEAIIENLDLKRKLFAELDGICGPGTVFASNTSAISITEMANATKRPDKFIGMHFFNPATIMKLVEVTRGVKTSDATYQAVFELSAAVGKEPVTVNEAAGFVVNKLLVPMINDAAELFAAGVASVADIDKAMKLGANHPMGPLALGDMIGLDVCLFVMETLYAETGDGKYRPSPLLRKMVRGGLLGKKTGEGFYKY